MRKVKRDYCNKGRHPKWRAWRAKYDMSNIKWSWIGNFCVFCNAKINSSAADGPPKVRFLP